LAYALGIDIGGTFTDIVAHDPETGRRWSRKVLTTHDDPARAVIEGAAAVLRDERLPAARFERIVHATTLFTNALIERKGAKTGLITTAGFGDTLEIGRERKYELYDIFIEAPAPLVSRDLRMEVPERIKADGSVHRPLDRAALEDRVRQLIAAGVESIAIVFLHAYANPAHEAEAAAIVAEAARGVSVTASHEIVRELREFERASTAVANAYVKPLAHRYLDRMADELTGLGIPAPLFLMLSNGGLTHLDEAKRAPVQLLESGPAAGALAGAFFAGLDGEREILAFDMGGTTAKLSLVEGGRPLVTYGFEAARQKRFVEGSGLPIRISTIELIEIGAGGGSIARASEIGLLKVGPESAGSEPGPASYGRGGTQPTVTDANFLLGYLDPAYFAGGSVPIDIAAAEAAVGRLAATLGIDAIEAAWGIHDIVNENMAGAARVHIAERGRDPRNFALLSTGGGGPVHAWGVAGKLGTSRIICPPDAGVASALGLLVAPARVDRVATVGVRLDTGDLGALEAAFQRLEADAAAVIDETGYEAERAKVERFADARLIGQGFNLVIPLPRGPYDRGDDAATRGALGAAFAAAYAEKFGRQPPDVPIELVNIRVSLTVEIPGAPIAAGAAARAGDARKGTRRAWFPGSGFTKTAVYDRPLLAAGTELDGPALVEEEGSTLVVPPGAHLRVTASGNIILTLGQGPRP
jgi:N-methylhydantoinase A